MNDTRASIDPRPLLAFRVGVTGSRMLTPAEIATLREPVRVVLTLLRDHIARLATDEKAAKIYRSGANGSPSPSLRLLSPLAEGADRLVAEEAKRDYQLIAPLPFSAEEYEKDFPSTVEEFRRLLEKAQVFALDGGRGDDENASYEAAGRFVARNCDLLIALWDGTRAKGRGGSAEIVSFAAGHGIPVWWIDLAGVERLISRPRQLKQPAQADHGEMARLRLLDYVSKVVLPPVASSPERQGPIGRVVHYLCKLIDHDDEPLTTYLEEAPPRWLHAFGWVYGAMYNRLAPKQPSARSETFGDTWWREHCDRANAFSIAYGDPYRSSFVLIIALAFLALCAAVLGDKIGGGWPPAVELALLAVVAVLVAFNHLYRWQERWVDYRLLAELCRKQMVLAPLARALPGAEIARSSAEAIEGDRAEQPREAWVSWYFLALQRAAPLPVGSAGSAVDFALAAGRSLVRQQYDYHRGRHGRAHQAEKSLAFLGESFFLITAAGLVAALTVHNQRPELGEWADAFAIVLSAASAAFVGLRAYTEFSLLARQSRRMEVLMKEVDADFDAFEHDRSAALASQDLGGVLYRLAMAMMQEVTGWAQLFRLKAVELG